MRNLLLLFYCIGFATQLFGQNFWVANQDGSNVDETLSIDHDADGNSYITGYFSSTATIGFQSFISAGITDVFVSKLDPNGNPIWSASAGSSLSDRGLGVASDMAGNLLVCGYYTGTIDFGNGVTLTSVSNSQDVFIAKYNTTGQVLWARSGGSSSNGERANAVATDGSGKVYITGQFSGTANFEGQTITAVGSSSDVFTACYSSTGTLLWLKSGVGPGSNRGIGIAASAAGDIYITGAFSESITFDVNHPNQIVNALFLLKYSSTGQELWFNYAGGSQQSTSYAVAEHEGAVYITGDCGTTLTFFNSTTFPVLENPYENGVFLAKFNTAGQFDWGRVYGSNSFLGARGLDCNAEKVVITGGYECRFDSLSNYFGPRIFMSVGSRDVFVISHDSHGDYIYSNSAGGSGHDTGYDVAIPSDGFEVIVGAKEDHFAMPNSPIDPSISGAYSNFQGQAFCGMANYGSYSITNQELGYGGFVFKGFEPSAPPLDLFWFEGMDDCDFSMPKIDLMSLAAGSPELLALDSVSSCPGLWLHSNHVLTNNFLQSQSYDITISPSESFYETYIGFADLIVDRADGCFTQYDTVHINVLPRPDAPLISDSWGINTQVSDPVDISMCPGDTLLLSAIYGEGLACQWDPTNNLLPETSDSVYVFNSGAYIATVTDSLGCTRISRADVFITPIPPDSIAPYLRFFDDNDSLFYGLDTLHICGDKDYRVIVGDSLSNTSINPGQQAFFNCLWLLNGVPLSTSSSQLYISNLTAGWNYFEVLISYADTICFDNPETYFVADSIFIVPLPFPTAIIDITLPNLVCPGSVFPLILNTNGEPVYNFDIISVSGDTLFTTESEVISASLTLVNSVGCTDDDTFFELVNNAATPEVIADPAEAIICPGESVSLSISSTGTPTWIGPQGNLGSNNPIEVTDPGEYFAEVNFYPGCDLVSNTIQVSGYATPYITAWPPTLCLVDGEVTLNLIATNPTTVEWFAPLSGSELTQVITEPGVYGAQVESCGVLSQVFITVSHSTAMVEITILDTIPVCEGFEINLEASAGFMSYAWSDGSFGQTIATSNSGLISVAALDGFGCYVVSDEVDLEFEPTPPVAIVEYESPCYGDEVSLTTQPGFNTVWYYNGDTIQSNSLTITALYQPELVSVILQSEWCTGPIQLELIEPQDIPSAPILDVEPIVCTSTSLQLLVDPFDSAATYHWLTPSGLNLSGGAEQSIPIQGQDDAGFYLAWGLHDGCSSDTSEFLVQVVQTMQVVLQGDTVLCNGTAYTLQPSGGQFMSYFWQDGSTDSIYVAESGGLYTLLTTDINGCNSFASTEIGFVSCIIGIPNAFSPNGDGMNEAWIIDIYQPQQIQIEIVDRWGKMVFKTTDANYGWDGQNSKSGNASPPGTYFYVINGISYLGEHFQAQGALTLFD